MRSPGVHNGYHELGEFDYSHHLSPEQRKAGWILSGRTVKAHGTSGGPNLSFFSIHAPKNRKDLGGPLSPELLSSVTIQNGHPTWSHRGFGIKPTDPNGVQAALEAAYQEHLKEAERAPVETLDDTARFRNLEVSEKKLLAKELLSKLAKSLKKEVKANWLDKPILDEKHIPELEQKAAFYQLHDDLPREEAEKKTYAEYTKAQRAQAGLHHLKAAKMALLAGDPETARKHGLLYQLHNKALGAEGIGPAHPDIVALSGQKPEKKHPFKTHDADIFISDLEKSEERSEKKKQTTCWCDAFKFPHRFKSHPGCPGTPTPKTSSNRQ